MENPRIVTEGKGGCYILMSPDFKKCKLDETNELLHPGEVIPFGFDETIEGRGHTDTSEENIEEAHKSAFKTLIEKIYEKGGKKFIPYVLIDTIYDSPGNTTWAITTRYQFLVKTKK